MSRAEPVDVLAVMDSCTDELEKQPGCYYTDAAKLQEARAAIAELIEAAESALRREEFKQGPDAGNDGLVRRLRTALARVGSAGGDL